MALRPGLEATVSLTVSDADTAVSHRSGDVPVLATPRLIALCEEATVAAIADHLDTGQTSVGTSIGFEHLEASPVGARVTAHALLVEIDRRALTFAVTTHQGDQEIGWGRVVLAILDRKRFLVGLKD